MADTDVPTPPSLADMQHWTWVLGRAQQMMLEAGIDAAEKLPKVATPALPPRMATPPSRSLPWTRTLTSW